MNYKSMSDSELAKIMVNYIGRVANLKRLISTYLDSPNRGYVSVNNIKEEYRVLKNELREDAHYLELQRNREGSELYLSAFAPSIREAAAFGFTVPINGAIDYKMFSAVADAHYKLTKYLTLEEWGELM